MEVGRHIGLLLLNGLLWYDIAGYEQRVRLGRDVIPLNETLVADGVGTAGVVDKQGVGFGCCFRIYVHLAAS